MISEFLVFFSPERCDPLLFRNPVQTLFLLRVRFRLETRRGRISTKEHDAILNLLLCRKHFPAFDPASLCKISFHFPSPHLVRSRVVVVPSRVSILRFIRGMCEQDDSLIARCHCFASRLLCTPCLLYLLFCLSFS